jgi:phosphoribosylaminoimidazole (AIR) synthetase
MGIGMALVVSSGEYPALKKYLEKIKLKYYKMGDVIPHKTEKVIFKR